MSLLALVVAIVLLAEGALLVAAFVSPEISRSLTEKVREAQEEWEGTEGSPGLRTRLGTSAKDLFDNHIATLWRQPSAQTSTSEFAKCISCHQDFQTKSRFSNVYMDHPLHAEEGLACGACHTMVQHPSPGVPSEDVCAECHEEVNQKKACDLCHPPGTLPHFYELGLPRTGAVDCSTCHPKDAFSQSAEGTRLVRVGSFTGDPKSQCLKCHTAGSSTFTVPGCGSCHDQQHPADWVQTHGQAAAPGGATLCQRCHSSASGVWCASRCHPNSPGGNPKVPLPSEVP